MSDNELNLVRETVGRFEMGQTGKCGLQLSSFASELSISSDFCQLTLSRND